MVTGIGDAAPFTYKKSRRGDADIDRAVQHVLRTTHDDARVVDFSPYGYDERQFCSPGFNLPVGRLGRSVHGEYPEYHTSGDNLELHPARATRRRRWRPCIDVVNVLEGNGRFVNLNPKCEPQLGRRGLYRAVGGAFDSKSTEMAILWVLNYSDGDHDLLDIASRAALPFDAVKRAADLLVEHDLLAPVPARGEESA